jgi:excisionase family DNA binding protein
MDRISIKEACTLLGVSRPTLNAYREKYRLSEIRLGGKIRLSKTEIIEKVMISAGNAEKNYSLTLPSDCNVREIQPLQGVYDLRRLQGVDAYGVLALLCSIKAHLKESESNSVSLLVDGAPCCSYLESIGFFTEVERAHHTRVSYNSTALKARTSNRTTVILPLHLIGYRGAEKKILDELYDPLLKQGFSENYCGRIGWVIGELCDNAHTHSEGPCYLIIEGLESPSTATRYLTIAIGDIGIGIPASLKKNPRYSNTREIVLMPMAFQSEVSRMEVQPKRGKGLNDVIAISKGNSSWLRVESGNIGMMFDFTGGQNKIRFVGPIAKTAGTRFGLVLIDSEFKEISRASVNDIMQNVLEEI